MLLKYSKSILRMKTVCLILVGLVAGSLGAPQEAPAGNRLAPRAGINLGISTPDFKAMGDRAKEMVKNPTEIAKDSVGIVKDSVKMGTDIGSVAVSKGTDLAKQGIEAATDIGKMGINMGTTIADKTLGIVGKVGTMIPIAGGLVTSGADAGKAGVGKVKDLGDSILSAINGWAGKGLGWISSTTNSTTGMITGATDRVTDAINAGLDMKADRLGNIIAGALGMLPEFNMTAGVNING